MGVGIKISLSDGLYLKDPQETALGKKIILNGILLIDEIGFEAFNFKKLAEKINSTEASVYRYFNNKHKFLVYLVSWYWEWVSYLIDVNTRNIVNAKRKLEIIIATIVSAAKENPSIDYVNESVLHRIIIAEGTKAYHIKDIDKENKEGLFLNYKSLVDKIAASITAYNSNFPYPHTLASNLFEMSNNQIYFAQHLPRLTDVHVNKENYEEVEEMLNYFTFQLLENN